MALNPKQEKFIEEYLVDFNGTQAAIRAGYSRKTAASQASDLLKLPHVSEALARARKEQKANSTQRAETNELTRQWVLDSLRANAIDAIADSNERKDRTAANRALELLGKEIGMFKDRSEIEVIGDPEQRANRVAQLLQLAHERKQKGLQVS